MYSTVTLLVLQHHNRYLSYVQPCVSVLSVWSIRIFTTLEWCGAHVLRRYHGVEGRCQQYRWISVWRQLRSCSGCSGLVPIHIIARNHCAWLVQEVICGGMPVSMLMLWPKPSCKLSKELEDGILQCYVIDPLQPPLWRCCHCYYSGMMYRVYCRCKEWKLGDLGQCWRPEWTHAKNGCISLFLCCHIPLHSICALRTRKK